MAFAFVLVCFIKVRVGRLRPDFVARCMPTGEPAHCTGSAAIVMEGRKSFPSGHSALSFGGLAFLSLALLAALSQLTTPRLGGVWKAMIVALPWLIALHIALSRLQDFWHHWQDILVGTFIGNFAAILAMRLRFAPDALFSGAGFVPRIDSSMKLHNSPPPSAIGS